MPRWIVAAPESDVAPGQMIAVDAAKTTVLLANGAGQLCAAQDACTHRGGPLHEGSLSVAVVTCPWHGSRFNLKSGAVVAGPAAEDLQTYQTRVENGKILVQLP